MPRPLLLLPLLLAGTAAAQSPLPRDHNGHVVYRGHVELPGLTQAQVLARATRYATNHLFAQDLRVATLREASADQLLTASQRWSGRQATLRYQVVLHVEAGGCRYEVRELAVRQTGVCSPMGPEPGAGLRRPAPRYEPVEAVLDDHSNYDPQGQPQPHLRAYCTALSSEVEAVLAHLRAQMAKP